MSGKIGATVSSLVDVTKVSADTQGVATDTTARATQIANKLNADIEDTTTTLRTHFDETASQLRTAVHQHLSQVEASDWDGASKEKARTAASDLNTQITHVLESAQQGVEKFKTDMTTQSQNFLHAIDSEFNKVINDAGQRFSEFGVAVDRFRSALEQADQTIQYR
jgi:ElaB/YqjD/DUF883 family membrane-anchored ribosome-binding protein